MPYIKQPDRKKFVLILNEFDRLLKSTEINIGEMNYLITKFIIQYIKNHKINYALYNSIIGVLECSKLELYRRQISLYENKKCKENGEVK